MNKHVFVSALALAAVGSSAFAATYVYTGLNYSSLGPSYLSDNCQPAADCGEAPYSADMKLTIEFSMDGVLSANTFYSLEFNPFFDIKAFDGLYHYGGEIDIVTDAIGNISDWRYFSGSLGHVDYRYARSAGAGGLWGRGDMATFGYEYTYACGTDLSGYCNGQTRSVGSSAEVGTWAIDPSTVPPSPVPVTSGLPLVLTSLGALGMMAARKRVTSSQRE